MRRGLVVYRCGSEATVLYPDGREDVLTRRRLDAAGRDCPYCTGDGTTGWELQTGEGGTDVWRYREVTAPERGGRR